MTQNAELRSADQIIAEAESIQNSGEIERFRRVNLLIKESRDHRPGMQDKIIKAANYNDINEYWEVALSEPTSVTYFAFLLNIHQSELPKTLGDTERAGLSKISKLIDDALGFACKHEEFAFIGPHPSDADDAEEDWCRGLKLRPREAAQWFLSKPKRRALVPPSLREYLGHIEDGPNETPPPPKATRTPRSKMPSQEQVDQITKLAGKYLKTMTLAAAIQKIVEELHIAREYVRPHIPSFRERGHKISRDKQTG